MTRNSLITIITDIQTKPRPRFAKIGGFVRAYTPKTALTYERYIASEYQRQNGLFFGDSPLFVGITFFFKSPKDMPKYKKWAVDHYQVPCTKHKDVDNLAKSVLDGLNSVAYNDDKQIVELTCNKQWTNGQEKIILNICEIAIPSDEQLKTDWKKETNNGKNNNN